MRKKEESYISVDSSFNLLNNGGYVEHFFDCFHEFLFRDKFVDDQRK